MPKIDFLDPQDAEKINKQSGAELGQAQPQLELGFTLIKVTYHTKFVCPFVG